MVAVASLLTVIPTSVLSIVPHARLGTIDRRLVSALAPVGIVSAIGGACAVNVVPAWPCRIAFALFLVFVVSRLVTGRGASTAGTAQGEGLPRSPATRSARSTAWPPSASPGCPPRRPQRNAEATSLMKRSRSGRGSLGKNIEGAKTMPTPASFSRPSLSRTSPTEPASSRSRTITSE